MIGVTGMIRVPGVMGIILTICSIYGFFSSFWTDFPKMATGDGLEKELSHLLFYFFFNFL
jgi:hypothetical protein